MRLPVWALTFLAIPVFAGPAEDAALAAKLFGKTDGYMSHEQYRRAISVWWDANVVRKTGDPRLANEGNTLQPSVRNVGVPTALPTCRPTSSGSGGWTCRIPRRGSIATR